MEKVILFGGNGFLGLNVKDHFKNHKKYNLVAPSSKECNILNFYEVSRYLEKQQPAFIINSSFIDVNSKRTFSNEYVFNNLALQTNVLRASVKIKKLKRIIAFGSGLEYGDSKKPLDELHLLQPKNTYASIKAASSILQLNLARELGVPLTIFRLFNLYGKYTTKTVLYYIIKSILAKKDFAITSGEQIRDFMYAQDATKTIEIILDNNDKFPAIDIYNLASGKGVQLKTLTDIVLKEMNYTQKLDIVPSPQNEYWKNVADVSKLQKIITMPKSTDITTGLKETIKWIKTQL